MIRMVVIWGLIVGGFLGVAMNMMDFVVFISMIKREGWNATVEFVRAAPATTMSQHLAPLELGLAYVIARACPE